MKKMRKDISEKDGSNAHKALHRPPANNASETDGWTRGTIATVVLGFVVGTLVTLSMQVEIAIGVVGLVAGTFVTVSMRAA